MKYTKLIYNNDSNGLVRLGNGDYIPYNIINNGHIRRQKH